LIVGKPNAISQPSEKQAFPHNMAASCMEHEQSSFALPLTPN
jgi:hypothetical protein